MTMRESLIRVLEQKVDTTALKKEEALNQIFEDGDCDDINVDEAAAVKLESAGEF